MLVTTAQFMRIASGILPAFRGDGQFFRPRIYQHNSKLQHVMVRQGLTMTIYLSGLL